MKNFICLFFLIGMNSSFAQSIDPINKAIEIQGIQAISEKIHYISDHSAIFDYIPDFFSKASEEDLARIFSAPNFERFSVTGLGVIYERQKDRAINKNEISEILKQIFSARESLIKSKKEQSEIMVNNWYNFEERSIIWPCGLVVVFRNKQLTHVWFDFK